MMPIVRELICWFGKMRIIVWIIVETACFIIVIFVEKNLIAVSLKNLWFN